MWYDYMLTKCQLDNQSNKRKNMRAWRHMHENEPALIYNKGKIEYIMCVKSGTIWPKTVRKDIRREE